jgi:hypothetical protein
MFLLIIATLAPYNTQKGLGFRGRPTGVIIEQTTRRESPGPDLFVYIYHRVHHADDNVQNAWLLVFGLLLICHDPPCAEWLVPFINVAKSRRKEFA